MNRHQYPKIGSQRSYPLRNGKRQKGPPCIVCGVESWGKVILETSHMRGDDEVVHACVGHKDDASALWAAFDKRQKLQRHEMDSMPPMMKLKDPAMDEHVNPTIATVLHRCWPMPAGQNAQPTEEQRLAADLYNMQHKERLRQERALTLQIQYGDAQ